MEKVCTVLLTVSHCCYIYCVFPTIIIIRSEYGCNVSKENFAPLIPRLSCLLVLVGSLHHPGCGGGQHGALLVLLVTWLVSLASQYLSLLTLLQLDLRFLPDLRPQLHPQQGPPTRKGHPTHTSQRDTNRHGCHHQQH